MELVRSARVVRLNRVSMKLLLIDGPDHPLGPQGARVVPVHLIPDPSTGVNGVIICLVGNLDQVVL